MESCARRAGVLACLLLPAVARAQLAPVGVPGGSVRIELDGSIETWDHRFLDGRRDALGADLSSDALGGDLIPLVGEADARLARITGLSTIRLDLGKLTTDAFADEGRGYLGLSLGLSDAITIFGRLPVVRTRVQVAASVDAASTNAGLNPGETSHAAFFQELDTALGTLGSRLAAGDYDGDPSQKALAQATLASGTALRNDLFGLLSDPATASPFVPTATSPGGTAVTSTITSLQGTLSGSLGISGFTLTPELPATPVSGAEVLALLGDPAVGVRLGETKITFRGDAEAGVALTLADHWDRGGRRGGFRTAVEGLARFPTGRRARTDRALALGTGEGSTDIEARITTDLGTGRWGTRLEGGYRRRLAADVLARVAPPTQPFPGLDLLSVVRRDPGDVGTIGARPFYRLARSLAIVGSVQYWSRKADRYSYTTPADSIPDVDPNVLALDTEATATVLGIGLSYSNLGRRTGGRGMPVDAGWSYERVVSTTGGRVADRHTVRARFRVYFGLF